MMAKQTRWDAGAAAGDSDAEENGDEHGAACAAGLTTLAAEVGVPIEKVVCIDRAVLKRSEVSTLSSLSDTDRANAVRIATRYCLMKHISGAGVIEEAEMKKLLPPTVTGAHKALMWIAAHKLRDNFGLVMAPIWSEMRSMGACQALFD